MAASSSGIHFHYQVNNFAFVNRNRLKLFIKSQLRKSGRKIDAINFIFCTDEELLGINKSYLNHDYYTDIITFELSGRAEPLIADIYISIDRVRENAKEFGAGFKQELHRVIFHGILHLIGYKDKSKADQASIRNQETKWMSLYLSST